MASGGVNSLDKYESLFLKQTRKGCFRTLMGCDAKTEIKVATMENPNIDNFYIIENSSCCLRVFLNRMHPFNMNMSLGGEPGGPAVVEFHRPLACPLMAMKICCFQNIQVNDATGASLGGVSESCWYCVPNFQTKDKNGNVEFNVHMPTCMGCFPDVCAEGCCSCRIPFYIYKPGNDQEFVGKIVKNWAGLGSELIGVHQFEVIFPRDVNSESKARLVGATLLLNELFFKPNN